MKKERKKKLQVAILAFSVIFFLLVLSYIIWYLFYKPEQSPPEIAEPEVVAVQPAPLVDIISEEPVVIVKPEEVITETEPVIVVEESEKAVIEPEPAVVEEPEKAVIEPEEIINIPAVEVVADIPEPVQEEIARPVAPVFSNVTSSEIIRVITEPVYDAAYFADFYIEGESELEFELDTVYQMDLYINGQLSGNISVLVQDEIPLLSTEELKGYIASDITSEAYSRIFTARNEYMSPSDFEAAGVDMQYQLSAYAVYLVFNTADMPVQTLSFASNRVSNIRPLSDAEILSPAAFVLRSRYNTSLAWSVYNLSTWSWSLMMYSSNTLSLFDSFLDFSYSLNYNRYSGLGVSFGSYIFYHDFTDKMMRLSAGNINSGLLSPSGSTVGIRLDKSLSYSDGNYRRKSSYDTEVSLDKQSLVEVFNDERKLYSRVLEPGNYKLEDFVLYSGVNRIKVKVSPTDGSEPWEFTQEFSYYASLLQEGEFYYSLSLATGRERYSRDFAGREGALSFNLGRYRYQYDARNLVFSYDMEYGITNSLTFKGALSLGNTPVTDHVFNPRGRLNNELTYVSALGTSRLNINLTSQRLSDSTYSWPQIYMRAGHQANTGWKWLSSFNFGLSWTSPESLISSGRHSLQLSAGASGRAGALSWSLGGSAYFLTDDVLQSPYSLYFSLSTTLLRNLSLSASLNASGTYSGSSSVSGSVYLSYRFGSSNINSTFTDSSTSANFRTSNGKNTSFSVSVSAPSLLTPEKFTSPENTNISASLSSATSYFSYGLSLGANLGLGNIRGSLSLYTSSVFADGAFAISSSIPSSFVLIKQQGLLRGNDLSVGYSGSSSLADIPMTVNTGLYSGISSRGTNLMAYSSNDVDSTFMTSRSLFVPSSRNRGYVYRITADRIYTISAVVQDDLGELWINNSSPVYEVKQEGDSLTLTQSDSLFIFTDENGRFILSDVPPGLYAFDLSDEDGWTLALFYVEDEEENIYSMNLYQQDELSEQNFILPEPYSKAVMFSFSEAITSDEFWQMLYPDAFGGVL